MKDVVEAETWRAELPAGWIAEREGSTVAITHPDAAGTLHLTELRAARAVDDEGLREIALSRHGTDPSVLSSEQRGDFRGLGLRERRDENHVFQLYLTRGRDLLFVSYVCDSGDEELDADAIESILGSLRTKRHQS